MVYKRHLIRDNYRAEIKSLQILLSRTQAGPGRKVKQEQEEISRNYVPRLFLSSLYVSILIQDRGMCRRRCCARCLAVFLTLAKRPGGVEIASSSAARTESGFSPFRIV